MVVFGAGVAVFDDQIYGGPLTTGYQPGEVTFGLGAVLPNLRLMPAHLIRAMPMLVLALVALAWIIVRWVFMRRARGHDGAVALRDLWVALALAASWLAIWGLYAAYTWTADGGVTLQLVRFYLPAIGAISLLGAWLVTRIPGRAWLAGLTTTAVIAAHVRPRRLVIPHDVAVGSLLARPISKASRRRLPLPAGPSRTRCVQGKQ